MTNFPVLNVINFKMQQRIGENNNEKTKDKYQTSTDVLSMHAKVFRKKRASKRGSIIIIYFCMRRINGNKLNIYAA